MSTVPDATATPPAIALRPARGIAATWWYTFSGILFFESMIVLVSVPMLIEAGRSPAATLIVGIGGILWVLATVPLLVEYRHRSIGSSPLRSRWGRVSLVVAAGCGIAGGLAGGSWLLAVFPVLATVVLLPWPSGVRMRLVLASTLVLGALWAVDARFTFPQDSSGIVLFGFYATALPAMIVLSLWWWDVLVTLDQARESEARLAATQERLRIATDVHDLQGHHLQVIGLQLELAERLMAQDAAAALAHLRAARVSVDEARQGTRDLALRVRSVPLGDELANAVDLLRVAGMEATAEIDPDAGRAPASIIGPVVREATTNILRHGGGRWARLSLRRDGASWRFEAANDVVPDRPEDQGGSGLDGIARRAAAVGGSLDVRREERAFTLVMRVPDGAGERP